MKKTGEIESIVVRPLGLTGRRLLTDAEEEIIYNMIIECHERGNCITKTNVLQVVSDIFTFSKKIEEGLIQNDERTKAARISHVDMLHRDLAEIKKNFKWYRLVVQHHLVGAPHTIYRTADARVVTLEHNPVKQTYSWL